jgi:hypothetical protein
MAPKAPRAPWGPGDETYTWDRDVTEEQAGRAGGRLRRAGPRVAQCVSVCVTGRQLTGAGVASAMSLGPWPFWVPSVRPASAMPAPSRFEKAMAPSRTTSATAATA